MAIIFERLLTNAVVNTPWENILSRVNVSQSIESINRINQMYMTSANQTTSSPIDLFCRSFAWYHRQSCPADTVYEGEQPNRAQLINVAKDIVVSLGFGFYVDMELA